MNETEHEKIQIEPERVGDSRELLDGDVRAPVARFEVIDGTDGDAGGELERLLVEAVVFAGPADALRDRARQASPVPARVVVGQGFAPGHVADYRHCRASVPAARVCSVRGDFA